MIGSELRSLRERKGLSLRAVAAEVGLSRSALQKIETGANYPSLHTLELLADCLQVSFIITPTETIIEPLN